MPHNLKTLNTLIERKRDVFLKIVRKSTDPLEKKQFIREYVRLRDKCVVLAEELSLRSRRVIPNMRSTGTVLRTHGSSSRAHQ